MSASYQKASLLTSASSSSTYTCNTFTVYRHSTNDAFGMPYIGCSFAERAEMWREFPAFAEASLSSESGSSSTSMSLNDLDLESGISTPTPTSTPVETERPFATQAPAEPAPAKESSKAWVAGVAVGGVALVAIAGLVFWLVRRRNAQPYVQAPQMGQQYPGQQPVGYYAGPPSTVSPQDETPKETYPAYAPGALPSHVPTNYAELPELVTPTRR